VRNGRWSLTEVDVGVKIGLAGVALALIGIILTVIPVPPDQWPKNLSSWAAFLKLHRQVLWYVIVAGLGILAGRIFANTQAEPKPVRLTPVTNVTGALDEPEVRKLLQELLRSAQYDTLLVFGYTCETVWDHIPFELRHTERLRIRVLVRSWIQEAHDEALHNIKVAHLDRRPWKKADGIRHRALEPWLYKSACAIRYYSEHPFIKAILIVGPKRTSAFLSFYRWEEVPEEGGSPFKGDGLSVLYIPGETINEQRVLSYLRSQFEMIWRKSSTVEELTKEDVRNASHKSTDR